MEHKYSLILSQEEMDQLAYALVLLKVDAINCLGSKIGNLEKNSIQLGIPCKLLTICEEKEAIAHAR